MNPVVHFEIAADDPERLNNFFKTVFGWEITPWGDPNEPYYLVKTSEEGQPGIGGGIMKRKAPEHTVCNSIQVASVDDAVAKVKAAGGTIIMEKFEIPTVGWMAYFLDTEGNAHGLWEPAPAQS